MRLAISPASPLTEPAASPGKFHSSLPRGSFPFIIITKYFILPLVVMYKAPSSPRQRPLSRGSTPTDEGSQPPAKRLRLSEEDDEDEDQPLAVTTRMNLPSSSRLENGGARPHPSRRAGKGMSAMSTAQTAPVSIPPPSGDIRAEMNREIPLQSTTDVAVKVEDQMDESQLDRLVTGVTVDTAISSSSSSVRLSIS
jgi:histone acetyltransferase